MINNKFSIGGIEIDNVTFSEALERIVGLAQQHRSQYVVTPNVDHIVRLQEDADFLKIYQGAALSVVDGMPIVWASRWLGKPLQERVTGADLLPRLCEVAAQRNLTVYFLGAAPGVAQLAADKLQAKYTGLRVAGLYSPPFGFEKDATECQKIIDLINYCEPDILFVGLGSPKQERWIAAYQAQLKVGVMLGIGAAIAFAAGVEKRAPLLMQKTGLEWLHRLAHNPRRLGGRYLQDFGFFKIVYRAWREQRLSK
jgi:N-acetylglucosaminyldiphosphoundecaprenol N-acetyl-beta-D-mannosaminyltransferase